MVARRQTIVPSLPDLPGDGQAPRGMRALRGRIRRACVSVSPSITAFAGGHQGEIPLNPSPTTVQRGG